MSLAQKSTRMNLPYVAVKISDCIDNGICYVGCKEIYNAITPIIKQIQWLISENTGDKSFVEKHITRRNVHGEKVLKN